MQLHAFLKDTYGLTGQLTKLGGELDENFLFEGAFGKRVFKLMRPDCKRAFIEMQVQAHEHVVTSGIDLRIPNIVKSLSGDTVVEIHDNTQTRLGWMIDFVDGALMADARPWTPELCNTIGASLADVGTALQGFAHEELARDLPWDLLKAAWIKEKLDLFEGKERRILDTIVTHYCALQKRLETLPKAVIHNDANEMNIFVDDTPTPTRMVGLIDFGDITYSARIGDAAVAAAYAVLDVDDPLANAAAILASYHAKKSLQDIEIELFFQLILTRLAVSVTNSAIRKKAEPDNPYLVLNEAPAWRFLNKYRFIDQELVRGYFRMACGLPASPTCDVIGQWLRENAGSFSPIFPHTDVSTLCKLDLSFGSATTTNTPEAPDTKALNARIAADIEASGTVGAIGGWGEARPIYNGRAFGRNSSDTLALARTHHMGVDISLPEQLAVHCPYEGVVWAAGYAEEQFDYGGYIVLEHSIPTGEKFYSLYGHLDPDSFTNLAVGTTIKAGEKLAELGTYQQNGGWWPHLHLQILTETPPSTYTPPGACQAQLWPVAAKLCPNPALLLNLPESATDWHAPDKAKQLKRRSEKTTKNQKLTYQTPLQVSRGWKHFLCDQQGQHYIDAYNNVPHVGHANPAVIQAVTQQMELISTNTRYLHESLIAFAEELTAKAPKGLTKCFFTSSASEANDLAIRIAQNATGGSDMLVMEHGYHGITTSTMAISPYKFSQKNGGEQQDWVHVIPQPDAYRGRYSASTNVSADCLRDTQKVIDQAIERGRKIAGFISECMPSVGGQIVLPDGILDSIYNAIRAAGGLCIADDVQTSLGRLGKYFWGFDYQGVIPDIIVLGKPLGNGYPVAAVITTDEIADQFAKGPEFFSTFGGSTVSCAAGLETLRQTRKLNLQENAEEIGKHLKVGFTGLQKKHPTIGEIRGMGLFWGLDLVLNPETREPATEIASYVKNRLYEKQILIGTDGPFDNVLKIRPPMTFDKAAADALLHHLGLILSEKPAQI